MPTLLQDYWIEARLSPAGAADDPDWFRVAAWQGGHVRDIEMVQVAPGDYRSSQPVPTGALLATSAATDPIYSAPSSLVAMAPGTIGNTGGSQAHLNMQPFLVLSFCIALQGIFPSQT